MIASLSADEKVLLVANVLPREDALLMKDALLVERAVDGSCAAG